MFINSFGDKKDPAVVLLPPMMISGSYAYETAAPYFKGRYFIIAPDHGGHGQSERYTNVHDEYRVLKQFLMDNSIETVSLVAGFSLGAPIAYKLYIDNDFSVRKAWFDGLMFTDNPGLAEFLMRQRCHGRKSRLEKAGTSAMVSELDSKYGKGRGDVMTSNLARMTNIDIDNMVYAYCHCDVRLFPEKKQDMIHLDYGDKDPALSASKKFMKKYMPEVKPTVRSGFGSLGYLSENTGDYIKEMEEYAFVNV
ncbi:MAG: hypothetical protein J6F31_05030 [Oscillospiraceae bacterium]|nr:hypothetical protein [Oscillospiraceae bacterium]